MSSIRFYSNGLLKVIDRSQRWGFFFFFGGTFLEGVSSVSTLSLSFATFSGRRRLRFLRFLGNACDNPRFFFSVLLTSEERKIERPAKERTFRGAITYVRRGTCFVDVP